jgi:hypothetical protein
LDANDSRFSPVYLLPEVRIRPRAALHDGLLAVSVLAHPRVEYRITWNCGAVRRSTNLRTPIGIGTKLLRQPHIGGISAGAWLPLQCAIRERCRAVALLVPAAYLPVGTSIHGGATVSAIAKSDSLAAQPLT